MFNKHCQIMYKKNCYLINNDILIEVPKFNQGKENSFEAILFL